MPALALSSSLPETVPLAFRRFARSLGEIIDQPIYRGRAVADAEGTTAADTRRVVYQVRNRRGEALIGRFLVHLWLATTSTGAPQADQAVIFRSGTVLETALGDGEWRVQTDEAGQVVMDIAVTGAGTRFLRSCVMSRMDSQGLLSQQPRILSFLFSEAANVDYGDLPVEVGGVYDFIAPDLVDLTTLDAAIDLKIPALDAAGFSSYDCESPPVTLPTSPAGYADPAWLTRRAAISARLQRMRTRRASVQRGFYQQPFYNVYDATGTDPGSIANRAAWLAGYTGVNGLLPLLADCETFQPEIYPHKRTATADEVDTFCAVNADLCRAVNALVTPAADRLIIPFIYVTDPGDPYNGRPPASPPEFLPAGELARYFSGLKRAGADAIFMAGAGLAYDPATWQNWADTTLASALAITGYI